MMDLAAVFTPSDFVAVFNQTLEYAYPSVVIEGELAEFRISKNSWVYFKLQDEQSSVSFFGTVYRLPGPLSDGMMVRVVGAPRLHQRFGFSINYQSIQPVGEGSIKKAAELLAAKLHAEGLFDPSRKRLLPPIPQRVGLITAAGSAAAADFMKVLNERWGGVEVHLVDSLMQGDRAPTQIANAIHHFNESGDNIDVLVITRGGGSAEDLAAFNDERVVRAVAGSRVPTIVAIGHEVDLSLAELAADLRASTPSLAAANLVPDRRQVNSDLTAAAAHMRQAAGQIISEAVQTVGHHQANIGRSLLHMLETERRHVDEMQRVVSAFNPDNVLARGYAILSSNGKYVASAKSLQPGQALSAKMRDGTIEAKVESIDA